MRAARAFTAGSLAIALVPPLAGTSATAPVPRPPAFADRAFTTPLEAGLRAFYGRDFAEAERRFDLALGVVPDEPLAVAFADAAAAQTPGGLDARATAEEDDVAQRPRAYAAHVRLGFAYLFETEAGRDRTQDARDEFAAAIALDPVRAPAHVGLGVMRFDDRSVNRAKNEFAAALRADPEEVLAREYLGQLDENDLHDPRAALALEIDVPNLVPGYADIDFHLASVLYELHEDALAISYAERALVIDTGRVGEAGRHAETLLARIYLDEHRPADAAVALRSAIASGDDDAYARTMLAKIGAAAAASAPPAAPAPER